MNEEIKVTTEEKKVLKQVREIKGFYSNVISYVSVIILLFIINIITNPSYIWAWWPAMGWGIGVLCHGLSAFEVLSFFGPEWEKKQIEKRLSRKL